MVYEWDGGYPLTIAISLKINDGLILAADSATTLVENGLAVNVYNNANKIFNLHKGLPVGAVTWGAGSIGVASTSTLLKDFRARLTGGDDAWKLNRSDYSILDVAEKLKRFIYNEHYQPRFQQQAEKPEIGFIVAGYSTGGANAEEYRIDIQADGSCAGPTSIRKEEECGITWSGQPEALNRLILGVSALVPEVLKTELNLDDERMRGLMTAMVPRIQAPLISPAMPLKDAIDLADFLAEVAVQWSRFMPGAQSVGGPVEIAAISKHEGFRWIKRKYYFTRDLNPKEENGERI
jgi:hypothetical protein